MPETLLYLGVFLHLPAVAAVPRQVCWQEAPTGEPYQRLGCTLGKALIPCTPRTPSGSLLPALVLWIQLTVLSQCVLKSQWDSRVVGELGFMSWCCCELAAAPWWSHPVLTLLGSPAGRRACFPRRCGRKVLLEFHVFLFPGVN